MNKKSLALSAFLLLGCGQQTSQTKYSPGTYQGTGTGKNGPITVEVSVSEDQILSVKVVSDQETPAYADPVREKVAEAIVKAQSVKIDLVTEASYTQAGITEAAEDALKKASK